MSFHRSAILTLFVFTLFSCQNEKPAQSYATSGHVHESEVNLLNVMSKYQRFTQKAWYAGKEVNWELAGFYVHELEEHTEELVDGNVTYDGYNISQLAKTMVEPMVEELEESVEKKDQVLFLNNYTALINSCNACHTVTEHAYIKIIEPTYPVPFNQDFSKAD